MNASYETGTVINNVTNKVNDFSYKVGVVDYNTKIPIINRIPGFKDVTPISGLRDFSVGSILPTTQALGSIPEAAGVCLGKAIELYGNYNNSRIKKVNSGD